MVKKGFIRLESGKGNGISKKLVLSECGVADADMVTGRDIADYMECFGAGDTVVVCSLGDVAVSLQGLLLTLSQLAERGVTLESVTESWLDMRSGACDWVRLFNGLYVFGRQVASVRTRKALSRVKQEGKKLGRPPGVSGEGLRKFETGLMLYVNSRMSVRAICELVDMDPRSFYRYLKSHGEVPLRRKKDTVESLP